MATRALHVGAWLAMAGGVSLILVNAVVTPLLPTELPFAELAASTTFAWRQSLAVLAALLLCLGCVALYVEQANRTGIVTLLAFLLAFSGTAFLLAHEWSQVFVVRDLAIRLPESLAQLEDARGLTLFDIGSLVALSAFTLGWLAFAVCMLISRAYSRAGPTLLVLGFVLVPALSAVLGPTWGPLLGNLCLGMGWILLGLDLRRRASATGAA